VPSDMFLGWVGTVRKQKIRPSISPWEKAPNLPKGPEGAAMLRYGGLAHGWESHQCHTLSPHSPFPLFV
jgi:hypothetical protein